jgi:Iap family predicted aminopeptidase
MVGNSPSKHHSRDEEQSANVVASHRWTGTGVDRQRPGKSMAAIDRSHRNFGLACRDDRHRFAERVPGANDNLSGVAAVIALADALRERPLSGLAVVLVSAGAEEALQEGIRGFAARRFPRLRTNMTYFLNLETVGSSCLVLLEGEGPVRMHYYNQGFKNFVASCAKSQGIPLIRGLQSRNSTDSIVPSKHGYPTVTIVSVDARKLIPHYHLYSDLPENVDYRGVAMAARLADAIARALATCPDSFNPS